jgi:hypothetical protein
LFQSSARQSALHRDNGQKGARPQATDEDIFLPCREIVTSNHGRRSFQKRGNDTYATDAIDPAQGYEYCRRLF